MSIKGYMDIPDHDGDGDILLVIPNVDENAAGDSYIGHIKFVLHKEFEVVPQADGNLLIKFL